MTLGAEVHLGNGKYFSHVLKFYLDLHNIDDFLIKKTQEDFFCVVIKRLVKRQQV